MTKKREFGTTDAQPSVLYAKIDAASEYAYPVLATTSGSLSLAFEGAVTIVSGRKVVTTTGSAVQLTTSSITCYRVDLSADVGNDNPVVVGGSGAAASSGTIAGIVLYPGNSPHTIYINNLNKIYVDAQTNGDAVCYNYYAY